MLGFYSKIAALNITREIIETRNVSPCRITGENHSWGLEGGKGPRFPSSISERPSRPLGSSVKLRDRDWRGVCFRSKCIAKCTSARLECAPQSALEAAAQDVASLFLRGRRAFLSEGERKRDTRDFPCLGGLRVRLGKDKGNQTKRSDAGNERTSRMDQS